MFVGFLRRTFAALVVLTLSACGSDNSSNGEGVANATCLVATGCDSVIEQPLLLSSVEINADGSRVTFVQIVRSLSDGPFDNSAALEVAGNAVVLAAEGAFFIGLEEEPSWVRYSVDPNGRVTADGRLGLLRFGAQRIGFANTLVSPELAVSVIESEARAIIWNPTTMRDLQEITLTDLVPPSGFSSESFTTTTHNGLVYIPGRFTNWFGGQVRPEVRLTILDPSTGTVLGTAQDDRCASGGRVVFDAAGYGYVMGDGRNYSNHLFEGLGGPAAQDNCLLRIPPGGTDFESDYYYSIPSLTGGRQSITELEGVVPNSGVAFSKMFYPERLPSGVSVDESFGFWEEQAHRMWRIELADPPVAQEVQNIPFSTVGFAGSAIDGLLFTGESPDGQDTDVYAVNPVTNSASFRFQMKGLLEGIYPL
ncbi:MAG: hypothetical protein AAF658_02085 [Myxococcota bacterium]